MTDLWVGHLDVDLDDYPGEGTDILVTRWDDGSMEVAVRPGKGIRSHAWSPPEILVPEPADKFVPLSEVDT